MSPEMFEVFAEMCGWTLARGHARSGDRIAIAAYLGSTEICDDAIADFAARYARQNQCDFEAVRDAVADGRLGAALGVDVEGLRLATVPPAVPA